MNESRRKEIEDIIQRLKDIQSEIRQLAIADSMMKRPSGHLKRALTNLQCVKADLARAVIQTEIQDVTVNTN